MITSNNWEISYRYKDSLATCNVWASTQEQAEKKFKARKEFDYDPEFDSNKDEGNIRSVYLTPVRQPIKPKKQLDPLKKFVMFPEFSDWLRKYDSGDEQSLVKQVPLTSENIGIINKLAKIVPIVRRYRGPRAKNLHRECHKHMAEKVSIYLR